MDPENNDVLHTLQDVGVEIKKSSATVAEELSETFEELSMSVSRINGSLLQVMQHFEILDEVKENVSKLSKSNVITSLREALACKICTSTPTTVLVITACCGEVAGCGPCMQRYLNNNDTCVICKMPMFASKLVFVRFLGEVLARLT